MVRHILAVSVRGIGVSFIFAALLILHKIRQAA